MSVLIMTCSSRPWRGVVRFVIRRGQMQRELRPEPRRAAIRAIRSVAGPADRPPEWIESRVMWS
jgi:hypothetical protein